MSHSHTPSRSLSDMAHSPNWLEQKPNELAHKTRQSQDRVGFRCDLCGNSHDTTITQFSLLLGLAHSSLGCWIFF